ncbi:MAG: AraC family transcriptional regulator [Vicinamibacterales bacterium]
MNRVTPLVRTTAVSVERFDHEPGVPHRDPERERARGHAVSVIETGAFRVRLNGAWHEVTPASLFATTPGLEFSCAHDEEHPRDRCVSVRYDEEAVESLRAAGAVAVAGSVLPLTNRRAYLRRAILADPGGDRSRVEALAGALYWSLASPTVGRRLYRPHQLRHYAERVDRAKALMRAHYAEPLSLSRIAREVGMSVYQFARVFSELEGEPPHRFLQRVRLEQAEARLRDGASVTAVCFDVGFGSLSHFVSTFRRRVGMRPSDVRHRPRSARPLLER